MRFKPSVKVLVAVLLLFGAIVSSWLVISTRKAQERSLAGVSDSRARLIEMLGSSRSLEGRLLGMSYTSFDPVRARKPLPRRRLKEALALINSNRNDTEAERLSNEALVYSFGNELDLAIQTLTQATASKGAKHWMWSDLSVLYIERFQQKNDSQDLLRALDSSARAQDSPSIPLEARFNYALSLEKLSLFTLAQTAWKDYTVQDPNSLWSVEAKIHLRHLEEADIGKQWDRARNRLEEATNNEQDSVARALVQAFPQFAREYGEEDLLGRWGASWQEGKIKEAQHSLSLARHLARWIGTDIREHMLEDTVSAIDRATAAGGLKLVTLAHFHAQYQKTINDMSGGCGRSAALLREAEKGFRESGSPFFRWARLRVAVCQSRSFNYDSAKHVLAQTRNLPEAYRYPALAGHLDWTLGLIHGIEGDPAGTLFFYHHSLKSFEHARENENSANLQTLTAECLKVLGNAALAWNYSWRSLQKSAYVKNPRKKYSMLSEAANLAAELALPEAATRLMAEAIGISADADPVGRVAAFRWRAVLCARMGRLKEARDSISKARQLLSRIDDMDTRSSLRGDLFAIEGAVLARTDPTLALHEISEAIESYQRTVYIQQLADLLLRRGVIEASIRQFDKAEEDFALAIAAVEARRKNVPEDNRESFLDKCRQIYDEMAAIQLARGRTGEALGYVERARSQLLLDRLFASGLAPSPVKNERLLTWLQRELSPDTVLIEYQFIANSCHVWIIRRGSLESFDLGREDSINKSVGMLQEALGKPGAVTQFRNASAALFDQILRPIMQKIGAPKKIVFIPDRVLWRIPFCALLDRHSGRFVVEDFTVLVAPSATVHVVAAQRYREFYGNPASLLVVGNPVVDRDVWQLLPDLSGSNVEAEDISSIYPNSHVLVGANATAGKFLHESPRHSIIHMAVHSFPNSASSPFAFFILSPTRPGDSGVLYAHQVRGLRLDRTRLVVLDTCDSLGGIIGMTEGLSGLTEPFLSAGVPSVIGGLWQINDSDSRIIVKRLHFWIRRGMEPALALRLAQIEMIKAEVMSGNAFSWAVLEAFGA